MHTATSGKETGSPVQVKNTTIEAKSFLVKAWVGGVLGNFQKWALPGSCKREFKPKFLKVRDLEVFCQSPNKKQRKG